MSLFEDIFGSSKFRHSIDTEAGGLDRMFWNITTTTAIDVIYTCPKCKKKLGMESRFVEPEMSFDCPYCKEKVTVPREKEEKSGSTDDDG